MKYYTINEEAAANAKAMYSWSEYKHGTKTAEYKSEVDEALTCVKLKDTAKEVS